MKRIKLKTNKPKRIKLLIKPKRIKLKINTVKLKIRRSHKYDNEAIKIINKSKSYASIISKSYEEISSMNWHPTSPGKIDSYVDYIVKNDPRLRKVSIDKGKAILRFYSQLSCNRGLYMFMIFSKDGIIYKTDSKSKKGKVK